MTTKKLENQYIQFLVRCRPPTASDKRNCSARTIEVVQERKEIIVNDRVMRKWTPLANRSRSIKYLGLMQSRLTCTGQS
ncbi:hypothetical protein MRX96_013546 [Rhipicephalus microplus]